MALRLIAPGPRGGATLAETEALATDLLRTHELPSGLGPGWRFHFETTANRAGVCRHAAKTIAMAVSYALRAGWPDIRDTLLHEIAHAIVRPTHHHDRVWKEKAREIGCSTEPCTKLAHSAGRWIARCARAARGSGTA